jgi:hypothetical protein
MLEDKFDEAERQAQRDRIEKSIGRNAHRMAQILGIMLGTSVVQIGLLMPATSPLKFFHHPCPVPPSVQIPSR